MSKDINMRIKSRALNLLAEDYFNDKVPRGHGHPLHRNARPCPDNFWEEHGRAWNPGRGRQGPTTGSMDHCARNCWSTSSSGWKATVSPPSSARPPARLRFSKHWSITRIRKCRLGHQRAQPRAELRAQPPDEPGNRLCHPARQAGTGKTLLTLAAGLTQVLETKRLAEIIMTRVTVPVGEDIGFLPGDRGGEDGAVDGRARGQSRRDAYRGQRQPYGGDWGKAATHDIIRSRIKVKSLNFMRGRTFLKKYLIIDEAQNLTPKQMKTLITRAGPGTKVICPATSRRSTRPT